MTDDLVPADVRQFIIENLDSIAQLEALLLLSSDPDTAYTTAELASRLYTDQKQAGEVLASLHSTGFTVFADKDNTSYRYEPRLPELAEMVTRLAAIYSQYLIPVTNLIHSKPQTRVQKFADAFKIRKEADK